jgi:hypothetical protein
LCSSRAPECEFQEYRRRAFVAQWKERPLAEREVAGSTPAEGTDRVTAGVASWCSWSTRQHAGSWSRKWGFESPLFTLYVARRATSMGLVIGETKRL